MDNQTFCVFGLTGRELVGGRQKDGRDYTLEKTEATMG